jgi:hypothetical protein
LVSNRITQTNVQADFEQPQLSILANHYVEWMKNDRSGAWEATIASLVCGFLMILVIHLFKSYDKCWIRVITGIVYLGLFVMPILKLSGAINDAEKQRQEADDGVSEIMKASSPITTTPDTPLQSTKLRKPVRHGRQYRFRKG